MSREAKDLVVKALRKVVAMSRETANCGVCGLDDDGNDEDHAESCPYPDAVKALAALGMQ